MKQHHGCPITATANVFTGKWKTLILWHVAFTARRFAELRDLMPDISEKVLTSQLRELERDGVITRTVTPSKPPRVDYSLSESGRELMPALEAMCAWGTKHLGVPPLFPPPEGYAPSAVASTGV